MPYGQKGVDGGSKWRTGTRDTEVRLDEWLCWMKDGFGQQRNDGGAWATITECTLLRMIVHSTKKVWWKLIIRTNRVFSFMNSNSNNAHIHGLIYGAKCS